MMYYGHQPWSDLMNMSVEDLYIMADEVVEVVNKDRESTGGLGG